ncbi:hypothetical protein PPYR_13261 [Photinus pyralis]|uniref:Major facilitator superfamily (MFS) profile domain-containing protein n=1 Tax=Photinus pyralis TaxID=7054 RepID=A0A1Y1L2V6_PHOPY|nr:facilitated trehalose transporter Tret1-like [Photinus pyralis]XP_031354670.1 facilitated trehalose transporter Tret1-like [Photinus pyralis]KAB0793641.1 hypothetical protein PPYR_13261 [Photinus pyralis]
MYKLKDCRYMQYVASITITVSMACAAMHMSWPSPTLPLLMSDKSPIGRRITPEEGSWLASSFLLGSIPGCLFAGSVIERFGRKPSLLFAGIPLLLPWITTIFSDSLIVLCIVRFFGGIGLAFITTAAPMYVGEIAEKDIRGKLGSAFNILRLAGSLYVFSAGPFISYLALAITCAIFPVLFIVAFAFMPESPYYLMKTNQQELAKRNLIRLSSTSANVDFIDRRMKEIEATVDYDMRNRASIRELFTNKLYRKSIIVIAGIKTVQQLSGVAAIEAYTQSIIQESGSSISPAVSSIIAGLIQFPAALLAGYLADRVGRKPLMIVSCLGCGIALTSEGIYFYLQNIAKADVSSISWLPTTALLLYLVMNPIGIFTLPWILLGELFATNIKGYAVSMATCYGSLLAFLATKLFQPISDGWGMNVTFWIFAAICFFGAVFCYFFQPETKGKTLAEIQQKLNRRKETGSPVETGSVLETKF